MNLVMIKIHNLEAFCLHTLPVSAFILTSTRVFKNNPFTIYNIHQIHKTKKWDSILMFKKSTSFWNLVPGKFSKKYEHV